MAKSRHRIGSVDELDFDGSSIVVEIDGMEIGVYRIDGEYFAIANYCVHQAGPLCEGEISGHITEDEDTRELTVEREDEIVACPWHSWKFDVKTGKSVSDERYAVPTYDVEVQADDIYVVK